jgi:dUTP pyrophosphatase
MVRIFVHKTNPQATIPTVAYDNTSACFDITCIEDTIIPSKGSNVVPNGLNLSIDQTEKYYMQIHLRSSMGFKKELICHPGIIDASYTGDLGIKLYNLGEEDIIIKKGERYAQVSVHERPCYIMVELDDEKWEEFKNKQIRGDKGFGSTNELVKEQKIIKKRNKRNE